MVTESGVKSLPRHPDEAMRIRRQLRRLRVRFLSIEHFGDSLAFVRRQSRNKNQRSDSLVVRRRYYRAGISVRHQN